MATDSKATQKRITDLLKEWKSSDAETAERYTLPIHRGKELIGRFRPVTRESIDDPESIRLLAEFRETGAPFFPSQFNLITIQKYLHCRNWNTYRVRINFLLEINYIILRHYPNLVLSSID